jgi:DHA1 family tetracycline resistance protein-like MFS transporter
MGITGIVGPSLFNLTFAHFITQTPSHHVWPGAPFWLASALIAVGLIIAAQVTRTAARTSQSVA